MSRSRSQILQTLDVIAASARDFNCQLETDLRILLFSGISDKSRPHLVLYSDDIHLTSSRAVFYQVLLHAQRYLSSRQLEEFIVETIHHARRDMVHLMFNDPSFFIYLTQAQLEAARFLQDFASEERQIPLLPDQLPRWMNH